MSAGEKVLIKMTAEEAARSVRRDGWGIGCVIQNLLDGRQCSLGQTGLLLVSVRHRQGLCYL